MGRTVDDFESGDEPLPWGPFRLLDPLGEGQFGRVFKAEWISPAGPPRIVALKVLRPYPRHARAAAHKAFFKECRIAQGIRHPRLVEAFQSGEHDGRLWLAMQFLEGGSLADRIEAGPLPAAESLRIALDLCDALSALHTHEAEDPDTGERRWLGLVHRDVKPANVLFDSAGRPSLADFGVAKATTETASASTAGIKGSPAYMSPEQAHPGSPLDGRSDIWSLGVLLFQTLTGNVPFPGPVVAVISQVVRVEEDGEFGRPLDRVAAEAEAAVSGLGRVVFGCLRRDPALRYTDAQAVRIDLERLLDSICLDLESNRFPRRWADWELLRGGELSRERRFYVARRIGSEPVIRLIASRKPLRFDVLDYVATLPGDAPFWNRSKRWGTTHGIHWIELEDAPPRPPGIFESAAGQGSGTDAVRRRLTSFASAHAALRAAGVGFFTFDWHLLAPPLRSPHALLLDLSQIGCDGLTTANERGLKNMMPWIGKGLAAVALGRPLQEADDSHEDPVAAAESCVPGLGEIVAACRNGDYADATVLPAVLGELFARQRLDFDDERYPRRWAEFSLRKALGEGAMGKVWVADWHGGVGPPKRVALKVLKPVNDAAVAERRRALFERELRASFALDHPNLVRTYQGGESHGLLWLAMELLDARTLADVLAERRRGGSPGLAVAELVRIGCAVADGLAALHDAQDSATGQRLGLVHRDLKPANVLVGSDGSVKLADFGIAKLSEADAGLTGPDVTRGTPTHMSPEQWGAQPVDRRSDVFALGVLLFEMATGTLPYPMPTAAGAGALSEIAAAVLGMEGRLDWIEARCDATLPGLGNLVRGSLRVDRRLRTASARVVAEGLKGLAEAAGREGATVSGPRGPTAGRALPDTSEIAIEEPVGSSDATGSPDGSAESPSGQPGTTRPSLTPSGQSASIDGPALASTIDAAPTRGRWSRGQPALALGFLLLGAGASVWIAREPVGWPDPGAPAEALSEAQGSVAAESPQPESQEADAGEAHPAPGEAVPASSSPLQASAEAGGVPAGLPLRSAGQGTSDNAARGSREQHSPSASEALPRAAMDSRSESPTGTRGPSGAGSPIEGGVIQTVPAGVLEGSLIERVVRQHMPMLRNCYQGPLAENPVASPTEPMELVVSFAVASDGSVAAAASNRPGTSGNRNESGVEGCVDARFERMQFPSPRGGANVAVRYLLRFDPPTMRTVGVAP